MNPDVNTNGFLLKVEDLKTYFPVKKGLLRRTVGYVKAVDGVSFVVKRAATFGLVGESGCGKTTAARSILRLLPVTSGKVVFDNIDILAADKVQLQDIRRHISLIFQDPFGSLNPRMTVGNIIGEPLKVHKKITGTELTEQVCLILSKVGLSPDARNLYPHEFSGGQRQRIGIARALILQPKLVICDEPVSALDVSIQSQILNLLKDLQQEFSLTYMFIAHDLAVVQFACDVVAVMYMGRIVEQAPVAELYDNPLHPYTVALMSAIPKIKASQKFVRRTLKGEVPSILNPPSGCPFHPRCPFAQGRCFTENPPLEILPGRPEHLLACWHRIDKKLIVCD
ncbi:MAG: oligopeptide/dipeptide ABC transporter ATP-binding protein [Sedimentisphaerales bacterium]|jgi:oligopeptide/dipeptide ABC transporter ATP-binding protein